MPPAERCATDTGVQSIDMHAGNTGPQPAVGGPQPTLTAEHHNGPQPAVLVEGPQPTQTADALESSQ